MRENKEKALREEITVRLSEEIERELHETLPKALENEMRRTVEKQLKDELEASNKEALRAEKERLKKKTEEKLQHVEEDTRSQLQGEFESKLAKLVETKEKEIKIKYRRQLELDKKGYEARAKENFEAQLTKEQKKFETEKSEFARQKAAYSVALHQFEQHKKETAAKLRDKELRLVKKQSEIKNSMRYIEPQESQPPMVPRTAAVSVREPIYSSASAMQRAGTSMYVRPETVSSLQKEQPQVQLRVVDESKRQSPSPMKAGNASLLPFSRALVNKAINEIGIDQMMSGISLSPGTKQASRFLIPVRKDIDELPDMPGGVERKYI